MAVPLATRLALERLLIPYAKHQITPEDEAAVLAVLRSPFLTSGPKVEEFEAALAEKTWAKYCVCTNSGSTALLMAYMVAKHHGYQRALVPAITFVATANMARIAELDVELGDCDSTGIMDFPGEMDKNTVVVSVTLGGTAIWPTMNSILDACHGPIQHPANSWMTCLSFHPAKHVTCGEGGAVLTNDTGTSNLLRQIRNAGRSPDGWILGINGRMPEMSAALGLSQLARYDEGVRRRKAIAAYYDAAGLYGIPRQVWHLYQILVANRDTVARRLRDAGIGTAVHYPVIPGYEGDLRGARHFAAETLSIPMYPSLTDAEVKYVASTVKRVVEETHGSP